MFDPFVYVWPQFLFSQITADGFDYSHFITAITKLLIIIITVMQEIKKQFEHIIKDKLNLFLRRLSYSVGETNNLTTLY